MTRTKIVTFLLLLVIAVAGWWWVKRPLSGPSSAGEPIPVRATAAATPAGTPTTARTATPQPAQQPAARLEEVLAQLAASPDAATSRRLLAELRSFLDRLPA